MNFKQTVALLFLFSCTLFGFAQDIKLFKDINDSDGLSASPGNLIEYNDLMYFSAYSVEYGIELWKSDGTENGTELVIDIAPGDKSSRPDNFVVFNGYIYFTVASPETGRVELWRTNGSAEGTERIHRLNEDDSGVRVNQMMVVNDVLFILSEQLYLPNDRTAFMLWRSDGTESGTLPLTQLGQLDKISPLTNFNNSVYFAAQGETAGVELWRSDGQAANTVIVKDINKGPHNSNPEELTVVNNQLFFVATSNVLNRELWISDGTETGTRMVKDIDTSNRLGSHVPEQLTACGNELYFLANSGETGLELWKSDGTEPGTILLKDIVTGPESSAPSAVTYLNGIVYFLAESERQSATEFWSTDGTPQGTVKLFELFSGVETGFYPNRILQHQGQMYIATYYEGNYSFWPTDGTKAGTSLKYQKMGIWDYLAYKGDLYLSGRGPKGTELYKVGSGDKPEVVRELNLTTASASPRFLYKDDRYVFFGTKTENGQELWVSDGTPEGTKGLVQVDLISYRDKQIVPTNGGYCFLARDSNKVWQIWFTDATKLGTRKIENVSSINFSVLNAFNGKVFMTGYQNGRTYYWQVDFDKGITTRVPTLHPQLEDKTITNRYAVMGDALYFVAGEVNQLWKTRGTYQTTEMVFDLNQNNTQPAFSIRDFSKLDKLYFSYTTPATGRELWVSDGTTEGTRMIADIMPGPGSSNPTVLANTNGVLLFKATDSEGNRQLWSTDGSEINTRLLSKVDLPANEITIIDADKDKAYFWTHHVPSGFRHGLWQTDGTEEGTFQLEYELDKGQSYLFQSKGAIYKGNLYFSEYYWDRNHKLFRTLSAPKIGPVDHDHPFILFEGMIPFKDKLFLSGGTVHLGTELFWLDQPFQPTEEEERIVLYPNPAQDYIDIIPPEQFNFRTYTATIYNVQGSKVHESTEMGDRLTLSITGLVPGMYFLRLDDELSVRFIKY